MGCAIDADGVVFHVGSHLGAGMDEGLDRVCAALTKALDRCSGSTWLLMENTAGAGATIGRSISELALLYDRLEGHPRLGVCLDSCHLYASGYDVTDPDALDAVLDELDAAIGLDRLRALHVNDSAAPLGSNRDRHASIERRPPRQEARSLPGQSAATGPARVARGQRPGRAGQKQQGGPDADDIKRACQKSSTPARRRGPYAFGLTCAKTLKVGSPTGSSENSGFRQPSSSPRAS